MPLATNTPLNTTPRAIWDTATVTHRTKPEAMRIAPSTLRDRAVPCNHAALRRRLRILGKFVRRSPDFRACGSHGLAFEPSAQRSSPVTNAVGAKSPGLPASWRQNALLYLHYGAPLLSLACRIWPDLSVMPAMAALAAVRSATECRRTSVATRQSRPDYSYHHQHRPRRSEADR